MAMGDYSIKDLEKLSGIKAHTIRIWEKRYGIIIPDRTETNRRRYTDADLRRLINISILNRNGFKISKIASLTFQEIQDKVSYMSQDLSQTDTQIESLIIAMINMDEKAFNDLLTRSIVNRGFEETYIEIVFPFLKRVGILWVTGSISPGQEHFVSNLIRQKLISTIDAQLTSPGKNPKRIVLFLPENELHELGLLFFAYLSKKNGHIILYLGTKTPVDSVMKSVNIWPADIIVTGSSSEISVSEKDRYIKDLAMKFKDQLVIIGGDLANTNARKLPENVRLVSDGKEFIEIINK